MQVPISSSGLSFWSWSWRCSYGRSIREANILLYDDSLTKLLPWFFALILLLATPTWLWGLCGRHNSPPASSVMDLVFRRSDGSHVSVETVHPSLRRFSSLSSPWWCHLQSISSCVVMVSSLRGQTTPVAHSYTSLRYSLPSVSP